MPTHDPFKQISFLRQALGEANRPIGILLGAGCPLAIRDENGPLIPAIDGMTDIIVSKVQSGDLREPFGKIQTHLRSDKPPFPNLEDYLSHVRTLRELAHKCTMDAQLNYDTLDKLDKEICDIIVELVNKSLPNKETPYHHLTNWIQDISRSVPIQLFTLNYDLLLEQALEDHRVPYFDGFIGAKAAFFDPYAIEAEEDLLPTRWARLWKLHGSINWWLRDQAAPSEIVRTSDEGSGQRRLIHPSHLKYDESRQMPYLAMMDRLKVFLQRPSSVLVTCGYRFGDKHINSLLRQTLGGNRNAVVFCLLHGSLEHYPGAVEIAKAIPRLNLIAKNGGIVGTQVGEWSSYGRDAEVDRVGIKAIDELVEGERYETRYEVTVGDFEQLGLLLQDMLGQSSRPEGLTEIIGTE